MTSPGDRFRAGPPGDEDRYRLGAVAGAGAEGVLYRAQHDVDGHLVDVAMKMLHPGHHGRFESWVGRWQRSVTLLERLTAPGLVAVHESFVGPVPHVAGGADDRTRSLYVVMDWVDGEPLWEWAQRQRETATAEALLGPLVSVAAALDLMHSGASTAGIPVTHGDVKPGNILVTTEGTTVLVDLGSVRPFDPERLSGTGGTAGYIAPEAVRTGTWGPAADRYALGAVAVALLSGVEPPNGATVRDLRALLESSPSCRGRSELVEHLLAMVDPEPQRRPTESANWVAQLRRSSLAMTTTESTLPPLAGRGGTPVDPAAPPRGNRVLLAAVISAVVAAVLVGAWTILGPEQGTPPDVGLTSATTGRGPTRPEDRPAASEETASRGQPVTQPEGEQWTVVPVPDRGSDLGVWTGTEFVTFMFSPTADRVTAQAYHPERGTWRDLGGVELDGFDMASFDDGDATVDALLDPTAAWTGSDIVLYASVGGAFVDPATGAWTAIPEPPGREVGASAWVDGALHAIVYGDDDGVVPLMSLDRDTGGWTTVLQTDDPLAGALYSVGDHLIEWDGWRGWHLDLAAGTASELEVPPEVWGVAAPWADPRPVAAVDDRFAIVGRGATGVFDPATGTWDIGPPMPDGSPPREQSRATSTGDELVVFWGGEFQPDVYFSGMSGLITPAREVLRYDLEDKTWSEAGPLPIDLGYDRPVVVGADGMALVLASNPIYADVFVTDPSPGIGVVYRSGLGPSALPPGDPPCPSTEEFVGARCHAVLEGDVDGDGLVDQVGRFSVGENPRYHWIRAVVGGVATDIELGEIANPDLAGLVPLDAEPGLEILGSGAELWILKVDDGRLVVVDSTFRHNGGATLPAGSIDCTGAPEGSLEFTWYLREPEPGGYVTSDVRWVDGVLHEDPATRRPADDYDVDTWLCPGVSPSG